MMWLAMLLGMAKPMPSDPPEAVAILALTPTTCPAKFKRGPPLFPGLMAASVCKKSL
jgi:hypothetical protein